MRVAGTLRPDRSRYVEDSNSTAYPFDASAIVIRSDLRVHEHICQFVHFLAHLA